MPYLILASKDARSDCFLRLGGGRAEADLLEFYSGDSGFAGADSGLTGWEVAGLVSVWRWWAFAEIW